MMQLSKFFVQRLIFSCSSVRPSAAVFKIHGLTGKKRYPLPSSVFVKLMDYPRLGLPPAPLKFPGNGDFLFIDASVYLALFITNFKHTLQYSETSVIQQGILYL
jgi:hypothetical protein